MTSDTTTDLNTQTRPDTLMLAVASQVIDGLAARDFDTVVGAFTDDVAFRALLPNRVLDLHGADAVRTTFNTWSKRSSARSVAGSTCAGGCS